jgi:hypothetical protein
LGELSISAVRSVIHRIAESTKPARILYISDFDPAGACMPVSVARKMEFYLRRDARADVRLFPLILTAEQVHQYRLPRTPIKESEKRRGAFEARHGGGAVELDALQALHPGELNRLTSEAIKHYYDTELESAVSSAESEAQTRLELAQQAIRDEYEQEIVELEAEHEQIQGEFAERMANYERRVTDLWTVLSDEMEAQMPKISTDSIPEARQGEEIGGELYDSSRDYIEQMQAYKRFQGKDYLEKAA